MVTIETEGELLVMVLMVEAEYELVVTVVLMGSDCMVVPV